MSQEFTISSGPLPGSEKIYVKGEMFDIEVPMRRINLTPTVDTDGTKIENEPVVVYDTSGPYGPELHGRPAQGTAQDPGTMDRRPE